MSVAVTAVGPQIQPPTLPSSARHHRNCISPLPCPLASSRGWPVGGSIGGYRRGGEREARVFLPLSRPRALDMLLSAAAPTWRTIPGSSAHRPAGFCASVTPPHLLSLQPQGQLPAAVVPLPPAASQLLRHR